MSKYRFLRFVLMLVLGMAMTVSASAESKFSFNSTPGQLPKDVIPQHYAITIEPDMKTLNFKGSEVVDINVQKAGHTIVLNSLELNIIRAILVGESGQNATIKGDDRTQIVSLTFPQAVKEGSHKLKLEFEGKIGAQSQGLHYIKYPTDKGEKVMLATQMEATDARRMFPCWDEPVYRTTYQLKVTVPHSFMAVSNTPVETERVTSDELKTVTFSSTPKMSSYLMVLIAGELEALEGESEGVQLRVITTEGKKEKGQYALEATKKLLPYYNEYFGMKYPLPKLDQIAIPGGFGGAMENWGGITYNESILLFDPNTSSQDTKETIFAVLSHEIAHQWFGNIVTMAWWDNLWLNEGFASWMGTKATDHFNPEWNIWLRANAAKNFVMRSDARKTTHPIQQPVNNPTDAARIFDEITYLKGEAFIRMLEAYLGDSPFRQGIRSYMKSHQYSNTTTADLWYDLEKASSKPISKIASGWTEQPGFPTVNVKSSCQSGERTLTLEQERFTVNDPNPKSLQWQIPIAISYVAENKPVSYVLLSQKMITVPGGGCNSPVKLNAGNVGYYRVKYDPAIFDQLMKAMNKLSDADRLNLLSDTWALAEAGHGSATDYLELAEAMRDETNLAIWEEIITRLLFIDDLQIGQPGRERFKAYARSLLGPVFRRIGWEVKPGAAKSVSQLRSRLIFALGRLKDEAVIAEARERFRAFVLNPQSLPADLREPVFYVVGSYSDRETFEQLHGLARQSQNTEEKHQFYRAMQGALDPKLAEENLKIALLDELPPEEAAFSLFGVAGSGEHAELTWKFAQQHMKELTSKLASFSKGAYVPGLLGMFSETTRADELEAYSKRNLPAEDQPEVAKAAEQIRFKAALKQREMPKIDRWASRRID
jgi:aminopeptidase N